MSLRALRGNLVVLDTGSSGTISKWASVILEWVLKDERLEQQRRRTQREIRRGERARERAQHYRRLSEDARCEYEATKALIQRLEELNNGQSGPSDADK